MLLFYDRNFYVNLLDLLIILEFASRTLLYEYNN